MRSQIFCPCNDVRFRAAKCLVLYLTVSITYLPTNKVVDFTCTISLEDVNIN